VYRCPFTDLSRLQLTVGSSILLTSTIKCFTPAVLANMACSRVWPPFSKPVSNSPFLAEITFRERKLQLNQGLKWMEKQTDSHSLSDSQTLLSLTSVFKQRPLLYHNHIALLMAQGFPWISSISGSTSWNFSGQSFSAYSTLWLTSTAKSACEAPPIMLGTKLLWPGASRMVKCFFSVSKYARPTSTVFPLSLSSWFVSRAQERYLRKTFTMKNNNRSTSRHKRQVLQVSAMFGGNLFDYPPDDLVN